MLNRGQHQLSLPPLGARVVYPLSGVITIPRPLGGDILILCISDTCNNTKNGIGWSVKIGVYGQFSQVLGGLTIRFFHPYNQL